MARLQRFVPDGAIILALFLLPLFFFAPQTIGGRTLIPTENLYQYEPYASDRAEVGAPEVVQNHLLSDLILQNYQWKHFTREQLAAGEVPLWNPHQFSGIPFLAAGQHSMLYPLSVIYLILPLTLAYGWFTVMNLWLAGVFMFSFTRGLGIGRGGAMLAGVVYQFSGFVLASVVFPMMIGGYVWLPLILLMCEFIIREQAHLNGQKNPVPWIVIGAAAIAMNVLAGHAEITIYTLLIAGYYSAFRLIANTLRTRAIGALIKRGAYLLALVILGLGVGAVQLIPLFEFVQTNFRADRADYDTVVSYAHPARDIVQFAIPNFYGNPSHHSITDVFTGEVVTNFAPNQNHTEWGIKNYVEAALYVGILPLLLAVYALIDRALFWSVSANRRTSEPPYRALFAVLGIFSLTLMFGLPTYRLIYALPGINQLNSPFRWVYALTVCVAVLAAFGLDALIRRAAASRHRLSLSIGVAVTLQGLLVLIGLYLSRPFYARFDPLITLAFENLAGVERAFASPQLFYDYQFMNLTVFGLALVGAGLVFLWAGWMRAFVGVHRLAFFAVFVVVADLFAASWGFNPNSDPALLDHTPASIAWLQEQDGDFRYTTYVDPEQGTLLNANMGWMHGLDDIRGYDSIISAQYMNFIDAAYPQVQRDFNRVAPIFTTYHESIDFDPQTALTSPALDLLNVRYVVTGAATTIDAAGYALAYEDDAVRIYENTDALPRAYITTTPDTVPDDYRAVTITRDTGREKVVDVSATDDEMLVISETYADGWRAFIRPQGAGEDQESALAVRLVAGNLQGVDLPAGEWSVRLVYSPASFQVGLFGSAISVIALTLLVGIWLWRVFVGVNTGDSSTTARVARNSIAPIILNLFNRGIDFVFAIVMLRLLDQTSVGVYYFAVVIFVWFDIFTNFGLDLFLIREVSKDKARSGYYFFNTTALRLGLSFLGVPLLIGFMVIYQGTVDQPLTQDGLIALGLLYVGLFPASLSKGMTSLFYAFEQAEKPAAIATITTINKVIFGVIALLLGYGIIGLAAVSIVNNLLTFGVLVWTGRALIGQVVAWRPDTRLIRGMIGESWPLMLNHFLATIFFQFDIVILQALRGAEIVARYSVSYRWLLAINIIPAFFTQALFPVMSRQASDDQPAFIRSYNFGIKLMIALAIPVAVAFTVLAEPLTLILAGAPYLPDAAIALTLMIWSIPFGWMNSLTQYALIALGKQRAITWAFFIAVTFNIVTNLIFIPQFGFRAAALTTIASEAALLIPFGWLMQSALNVRLPWVDMVWRPIVAGALMIGAALILMPVNSILALIVAGGVYGVVLIGLRPLNAEESAIVARLIPAGWQTRRVTRLLIGTP